MRRNIRKIDKAVTMAQEVAKTTGEAVNFVKIIDELAETDDESFRRCYAVLRQKLNGAQASGSTSTEDVILGMLPRCVASAIGNRGGGGGLSGTPVSWGSAGPPAAGGKARSARPAATRRSKRPRSVSTRTSYDDEDYEESPAAGGRAAAPASYGAPMRTTGPFTVPLVPQGSHSAAYSTIPVPTIGAVPFRPGPGQHPHLEQAVTSALAGGVRSGRHALFSGHFAALTQDAAMQGGMVLDVRRAAANGAGHGPYAAEAPASSAAAAAHHRRLPPASAPSGMPFSGFMPLVHPAYMRHQPPPAHHAPGSSAPPVSAGGAPSPKRPRLPLGGGAFSGEALGAIASALPPGFRDGDRNLQALATSALAGAASAGLPTATAASMAMAMGVTPSGFAYGFASPAYGSLAGGPFAIHPGQQGTAAPPQGFGVAAPGASAALSGGAATPASSSAAPHYAETAHAAHAPASAAANATSPSSAAQQYDPKAEWRAAVAHTESQRRSVRLRGRPGLSVNTEGDEAAAAAAVAAHDAAQPPGQARSTRAGNGVALGLGTGGRLPSVFGAQHAGAFGAPSPPAGGIPNVLPSATGGHPASASMSGVLLGHLHPGMHAVPVAHGGGLHGGPFALHSAGTPGQLYLVSPNTSASPGGMFGRQHGSFLPGYHQGLSSVSSPPMHLDPFFGERQGDPASASPGAKTRRGPGNNGHPSQSPGTAALGLGAAHPRSHAASSPLGLLGEVAALSAASREAPPAPAESAANASVPVVSA